MAQLTTGPSDLTTPPITGFEAVAGTGDPSDIVGHKTLADGSHEPLRRDEAEALWARCMARKAKREADMPDEKAALDAVGQAFERLRELGWREAIYCPKDGTAFQVIEPGSTAHHRISYATTKIGLQCGACYHPWEETMSGGRTTCTCPKCGACLPAVSLPR